MAVEYYVIRRGINGSVDKRLVTCETSEQAWKYITDMPKPAQMRYYVQYSKDAIRDYELKRAEEAL